MQPNVTQVRAINSISRKFSLNQQQLTAYYKGLREGHSENSLLAVMLGAPEGVDSLQYLTSLLSAGELTALKNALYEMAPRANRKS